MSSEKSLGEQYLRSPNEKELKDGSYGEKIGKRYDALLAERETLSQELEKFEYRDYGIIFNSEVADDKKINEVVEEWLKKVRSETRFLEPIDNLGIKVFTDELEKQPNFPKEKITFGSKEVAKLNIASLTRGDGFAYTVKPEIEIGNQKLTKRDQMAGFLSKGLIHPAVSTLIHELIHRYHLNRTGGQANLVLSEAQAYFSGIFEEGAHFSSTRVINELSNPDAYGYDSAQVIEAIKTVAGLYSLGKSEDEVADLIVKSGYDTEKNKFTPITEVVENLKKEYRLNEIDMQALDDIYRLHANNQRMKAQLLLYKTLKERFPQESLKESKKEALKRAIAIPRYWQEGKPVESEKLLQRCVCPMDKDFPYDPDGKRTGVIFGFFPDKGAIVYNIGRYEAEGKESKLELAQSEVEIKKYLDILAKQAEILDFDDKAKFLSDFFTEGVAFDQALFIKVLKTLINKDEAKEMLGYFLPSMELSLKIVSHEISVFQKHATKEVLEEDLLRIEEYFRQIYSLIRMFKVFDMNMRDIDKEKAVLIKSLEDRADRNPITAKMRKLVRAKTLK
ncbi:MAG: hypothetical protein AAB568_02290 [Patescibacteria group bacterium]